MHATVGDHIVIRSNRIGMPERDAEVLECGPNGGPPYRVRWVDTGHEGLFFPGTDAYVQHPEHPSESTS